MTTVPIPKRAADAIREAIEATRSDDQDGYSWMRNIENGRPMGVHLVLPPTDVLELARAVGIEPDPIEANGSCSSCLWALVSDELPDGRKCRDRGWSFPCASCSRPKMTLWGQRPENICPGSGNTVAYRDDAVQRPGLRARAVRGGATQLEGFLCPHCGTVFALDQLDKGGLGYSRLLPHTTDGGLLRTETERQEAAMAHRRQRRR